MKFIIDIGHPAHVHYFRNFYKIMKAKGAEFLIIARDKEVSHQLLKEYEIPYVSRGMGGSSILEKFFYIFSTDKLLIKKAHGFKPDFFIGFASTYAAHAAKFCHKPCILFDDTEHAKYEIFLYRSFATLVFTPFCFNKDLGKKQIRFQSFMELSYLHPKYYTPDNDIYNLLGIKADQKFILLRFISWAAAHDIGHSGLNMDTKRAVIERFKDNYKIFISAEGALPEEFEKYRIKIPVHRIHDVLAFAHFFIGEGATMASECAMLTTPAIYVNSLDAGTLQEQERRGLIKGFRSSAGVLKKIDEWLTDENLHTEMKSRRNKMLEEMIDPTAMLEWFVENYPKSIKILKENPEYQQRFR